MLKSIDIEKFGIYNNYKWRNVISTDHDKRFRRLNIIYGRNYSGKTTLSRIFRCVENQEIPEKYNGAKFQISLDSGNSLTNNSLSSELIFRVYNSDFIKNNLSWLYDHDSGNISPFTVLGEIDIAKQERLNKLSQELNLENLSGVAYKLQQARDKYSLRNNDLKTKKEALEKLLTKQAKNIKDNSVKYNRPIYNVTHIKKDIDEIVNNANNQELTEEQLRLYNDLLLQKVKDNTQLINETRPNFKQFLDDVSAICLEVVSPSRIIQSLMDNPELNKWVELGVRIHKDKLDTCSFCGSEIEKSRWDELDAHFTKEIDNFKIKISSYAITLSKAKQAIDGFINIDYNNFDISLIDSVKTLLASWDSLKTEYKQNLTTLEDLLSKKRDDYFNTVTVPEIIDNSDKILEFFIELNQLIIINNELVNTLATRQSEARKKLLDHELITFINTINYNDVTKSIGDLNTDIGNYNRDVVQPIELQYDAINVEKSNLESETNDGARAAVLINNYLQIYFKHTNLGIFPDDDQRGFRFIIKRNNEEAYNLSEGECSLISFCYFMAKISDELKDETKRDKLVIYIDDPISSLDSNNIFFMFGLIEGIITKDKHYKQLFLSTHNLEFLKYIKKLTVPKYKPTPESKEKEDVAYFIIERLSNNCSVISLMPNYLANYVTEFNYLFKQIHRCSNNVNILEHDIYNFGNNLRKFLESYLFFKYPSHKISNDIRLRKFLDDDTSKVAAINRITNEYSHLENRFDRASEPIDTNEINSIAKIILEQIKSRDGQQFDALVESIS